jgi:anti-sigma regulatory factor (Ser/Thr protein kinase)
MEVAVQNRSGNTRLRFVVDDSSKVGEARRAAHTLANFEFSADVAGKVAIAATELANNLLNHAVRGELLVQTLGSHEAEVIELLSIDRGPGMNDIERCMVDGYSTAGTPGNGLGAVRRLADEFDIHSAPGQGTIVMARFGKSGARYGAVNVPFEGEIECGDAWSLMPDSEGFALFVVDGLGHGAFAAEAARVAIEAFHLNPFVPPQETMVRANGLMSKTRGGAAACARVAGDRVSFAGIGNISAALVSPGKSQGLVSHNGTLGRNQRRNQQFEYRREPGALLIMHSDGLSARWDIRNRADLLNRHPAIIAAAIYREHGRGSDDATVVVVA